MFKIALGALKINWIILTTLSPTESIILYPVSLAVSFDTDEALPLKHPKSLRKLS